MGLSCYNHHCFFLYAKYCFKVPVKPAHNVSLPTNGTDTKSEASGTGAAAPKINLNDPGVLKRAFIVFGGFALLGAAYYFIFYR